MCTWNEWDPLEEVLVGNVKNSVLPGIEDKGVRSINYVGEENPPPFGFYPHRIIEETEEDLEYLVQFLESENIRVFRPEVFDFSQQVKTPYWNSSGYYAYCPRDSVLTYGDNIVETPMPLRPRYFETLTMRKLLNEKILEGYKVFSAPKPLLKDNCYRENIDKNMLSLTEEEPLFDAANCLKCGRDIFYLVSNTGNEFGAQWLESVLPSDTRIHKIKNVYSYIHIDSTISLLKPGLALYNPKRVTKDKIPEILRKWDYIMAPEPVDIGHYPGICHSSPWVNVNLLMVRPDLAVVDANQTQLIKELERWSIMVKPLTLRHARTLGGGFHCVTLDLKRAGSKEDYFF